MSALSPTAYKGGKGRETGREQRKFITSADCIKHDCQPEEKVDCLFGLIITSPMGLVVFRPKVPVAQLDTAS